MKKSRLQLGKLGGWCTAAIAVVAAVPLRAAQSTLLADTYVTAQRPSTNYGTLSNLYVNGSSSALLRFDLTALPPDATASTIGRAILRVYVNRVNTPGTLGVAALNSDWRESAVTFQTLPKSGNTADVEAVTEEGQYVAFDVTALVKQWAASTAANYGIALNTTTADVVLDSKESDTTAHPATLDITMLAASGTQGPKGDKGDTGATGASGPRGPAGPQGVTGPAGPQGPAGPKGDTGGLTYRGTFSAAVTYALNDVVASGGAAWVSLQNANTGNTPASGSAQWGVLVPAAGGTVVTGTKSLAFQGTYASTTNYALNDVVTWQFAAWVSLADSNHGNTPGDSPANWAVLVPAAVGLPGAAGATGPKGDTGPQGDRGPAGPQGAPGPAGVSGAIGRPGLVYQGAYQSAVNYTTGDVVLWQGSSWASLTDSNHGNTPSESPAQWGMLTSTGPKGDTGTTGAPGAQGIQGPGGSIGPAGPQGVAGPQGSPGPQGLPGRDGAQGPQGSAGPAGAQGIPGPVGITWQGSYDSTQNYGLNAAITWQGQTWLSLSSANHGNTPGTTADWALLAAAGATGPQGLQGPTGPSGAKGDIGPTGPQGLLGQTGATGPQGEPGLYFQGAYDAAHNYALHDAVTWAGGTWLSLTAGNHGNTPGNTADWVQLAAPGAPGSIGPQGATGAPGAQGLPGATGPAGPQGPAGATGAQGPPVTFRGAWNAAAAYQTGDAVQYGGSSWIATAPISNTPPGSAPQWSLLARVGDAGMTGATGPAGTPGVQGAAGPAGATGPQGAAGLQWLGTYNAQTNYGLRDAVTFNGSSYVSLTASNAGNTPGQSGSAQWAPLALAGSNGTNGVDGAAGTPGAAATIVVRNVFSGATPSITNVGTSQAAVLDFVLPRGDTGATGPVGPAGVTYRGAWANGTGYSTGDAVTLNGSSYLSLTNANLANPATDIQTGGGNWAVLAAQGATGADGAATVAIGSVTTGAPGSSAAVTNTGTQTAARLNFSIPRGDTGATGAPGLTWRGAWDTTTQYLTGDAVSYGGSAYVALAASKSTTPTGSAFSSAAWSLLAAQGSTGPTGATPTFSIGTVTTGGAGSSAAVTLATSGTANTLNFTIPRGDTGASGTGGGGTGTGAVFSTVHLLPGSDSGAQFYAVGSDRTASVEGPALMTRMPDACSVDTISFYNTGTLGASLDLRSGTTPAATSMSTVGSCTGLVSGASTCTFSPAVSLAGRFADLRASAAGSAASYLYTLFTCK